MQHLVLFRTKLWFNAHALQCGRAIAGNSFSYISADNHLLTGWKVCSVHNNEDRWYSMFDSNDLCYRLPVQVSRGRDTQSTFEALVILKRGPQFVFWNIWIYFTLTTFCALLTYELDPWDNLADRLGIAVMIIFVQMSLKQDSARKTPNVQYTTYLDKHILISLILVLAQAGIQVLMVGIDNNTSDFDLNYIDTYMAYCNCVVVAVVNLLTLLFAKKAQRKQRLEIESKVQSYTGFDANEEPLAIGQRPEEIKHPRVRVAGWKKGLNLQVNPEMLERRVRHFDVHNRQQTIRNIPGVFTCCGYCRGFF